MTTDFFVTGNAEAANALARRISELPGPGTLRRVERPRWAAGTGSPSIVVCMRDGEHRPTAERDLQRIRAAVPDTPAFGVIVDPDPGVRRGATLDRLELASFRSTPEGELLDASPAFLELLGFDTLEEARRTPLPARYADPGDRERLLRRLEASGRAGDFEVRLRRRDGKMVWVAITAVLRRVGERAVLEGVLEDVTLRKRADEALRLSETTFRGIVEEAFVGIFVLQGERFMYVNPRFADMLGHSPDEMIDSVPVETLMPESIRGRSLRWLRRWAPRARRPVRTRIEVRRSDGAALFLDTHLMHATIGGRLAIVGTAIDITERVRAEAELRRSEERYRGLLDNASDFVFTWDLEGRLTSLNRAAELRFGYSREEALGRAVGEFLADGSESGFAPVIRDLVRKRTSARFETDLRCADGRVVPVELVAHAIRRDDRAHEIQAIGRDITDRRQLEARLRHRALHDPLTGSANRTRLQEALAHAVRRARAQPGYRFALLFLDLDRFKAVNDTFGHLFGNRVLMRMTEALRECVRPHDLVARFGGDEFTVLLEDVDSVGSAIRIAERIQKRLSAPIRIEGNTVVLSASIGIAMDAGGESDPDVILRNADAALNRAKHDGRSRFVVFDEEMHRIEHERRVIGEDLRAGLDRGELDVFFQPIVDLVTADTVAFEALLRWHHPSLGLLEPDRFLAVAEESGAILKIDRWVLRRAIASVMEWRSRFDLSRLRLNVNLSELHLTRADALAPFEAVLRSSGVDPGVVCLEVGESAVTHRREMLRGLTSRLGRLDIGIHVDDFGTGVSSIGELRRLPVKAIKVDRSITSGLGTDADCEALVRTVQRLAEELDLELIAEGVETPLHLDRVVSMGIRYAQGHTLGEPATKEDSERRLGDPEHVKRRLSTVRRRPSGAAS